MPTPESGPNLNNPESNPNEMESDVGINKELEGESITPEEPEEFKKETDEMNEAVKLEEEEPELSPQEQIENLENEVETQNQEIAKLTESIEEKMAELNEAREKLGLPPAEENPPSMFSEIEKLQIAQEILTRRTEELISRREKERLIEEEKEKILQELLNELFEEFKTLDSDELESILENGKTSEGRDFESKSMGLLDPEYAMSLVKAFEEGVKSLTEILKTLPNFLEKFDDNVEEKATENVEQKIEEEVEKELEEPEEFKKEMDEMNEAIRREEELETPEGETPPNETEQGSSSVGDGNVETPKT